MLSLSRKREQSILIGSDLLEVVHIMNSAVHVDIHLKEGLTKTVRFMTEIYLAWENVKYLFTLLRKV